MPREKHCVHKHFSTKVVESKNSKSVVKSICNYCSWENVSNTTRLIKHIKDCLKCSPGIKEKVAGEKIEKDDTIETTACEEVNASNKRLKLNNSSMDDFILKDKTVSETMQRELEILFARAIYCSSTPLSVVENDRWIRFFFKLKPSFQLPSRYDLSNRLLNEEFTRVEKKVDEQIELAPCLALQMDGWSDIHRRGIINVILNTPKPFFFDTIPTGANRHTGINISNIILEVIEKVGAQRIVGIVTDNASNMKLAWKLVQEKYPHITAYGCLLHGIHLFFKDICLEVPTFVEIKNYCSTTTKEVKSSQILLSIFTEKQSAIKAAAKESGTVNKQPALQTQGKTRFGTIFLCMQSVFINKIALREMCIDTRAEELLSSDLTTILLNTNFWDVLEECVTFLKPFISWLHKIESDEPLMSSACTAFSEIREHIQKVVPNSPFLSDQSNKINQILEDRYDFCIKPVHYAANLLDPSKRGKDLIDSEVLEAQEYIISLTRYYANIEKILIQDVLTELNMFRLQEGVWKKASLNLTTTSMTPYLWWKACCVGKSLRIIALKVLSLPPTSAACERTNSTYGGVHNKTTNRLLLERAGKLTYIKQNWKYLESSEKPKSTLSEKKVTDEAIYDELCDINHEFEAKIVDANANVDYDEQRTYETLEEHLNEDLFVKDFESFINNNIK